MPPSYAARVRAIPAPIRMALAAPFLLIGLLLSGYQLWTYCGLYQWLVDSQVALIRIYYIVPSVLFTVVATMVLCLLPAALLQYLVIRSEIFPAPDAPARFPT